MSSFREIIAKRVANIAAAGTDVRVFNFAAASCELVTVNVSAQVDADPVCATVFA